MNLVFPYEGDAQFEGIWLTGAVMSFNPVLLQIPKEATGWVRYWAGAVANLKVNELLTGDTNHQTCRVVAQTVDYGSFGSTTKAGILMVNQISGAFTGEILTGTTSGGTVVIVQDFLPFIARTQPKALFLSSEVAGVNFTLTGLTPTVTATEYGQTHNLPVGGNLSIHAYNSIKKFQCINAVASSGAILKWSLLY